MEYTLYLQQFCNIHTSPGGFCQVQRNTMLPQEKQAVLQGGGREKTVLKQQRPTRLLPSGPLPEISREEKTFSQVSSPKYVSP
jgi:hypothetical protein